ncbi:MAG: 30S ribosomal protein S20 [Erysipelothrix sp.]|nr:30S ribosomal protein S20 [Erysipelothrix sp.]
MAVIASRKKQIRQTKSRTTHNKYLKSAVKTAIQKFELAVAEGDKAEAEVRLNNAIRLLDKSVSKNVHNQNYVNRQKATIQKAYNELN